MMKMPPSFSEWTRGCTFIRASHASGERPLVTQSPKVLLVDDDVQSSYVLQRYAISYGARLTAASFETPVVELTVQVQPAMILLCTSADDAPGRAALRALRSDPRTRAVPIVICAAHEVDRHGWAAEADGILVLPVMYADYAAMLDQATQPSDRP